MSQEEPGGSAKFRIRREADEALGKLTTERRQKTRPAVDPFITLTAYVPRFLADCHEQEVEPNTLNRYDRTLSNHVLPTLGARRLREITRSDVRGLLIAKRQEGVNLQGQRARTGPPRGPWPETPSRRSTPCFRPSSVWPSRTRSSARTPRSASHASDERRPPASGTERRRVTPSRPWQRNRLLAAAAAEEPEVYPGFMLGALAGLRLGEMLGLKWASVDFNARRLRVHEQLGSSTTKTGAERFVDMADPLVAVLRDALAQRRGESFRSGKALSPWVVFPWLSEKPGPQEQQKAETCFRRDDRLGLWELVRR